MANSAFSRALGTPAIQTEKARPDQVENNAGGFVFEVSDQARLERFLILGTDGGTYYTSEKKLTKENIAFLQDLIERNEDLVIDVVRAVSMGGRAYRNSAAIFTVAALFTYGKEKSSQLVEDVCRTATHLFEFAEYVELLGGWGRSKRRAVAEWYTNKTPEALAYQVIKYRQRNGWSHRDLLRLSHPVGLNKRVGNFITGEDKRPAASTTDEEDLGIIRAFKFAQEAQSFSELKNMALTERSLPWEAVPTEFHKNVELWKTLFYNGALKGQALLRNITRLARLGAFDDLVFARDFADGLLNEEMIKRTKLHPIQYLLALSVHQIGQVDRKLHVRTKDWRESHIIVDALNEGFYKAFSYVEPANKRTMIGLDVSGSMSSSALGLELSCAQIGAAMSMSIARTEPYYAIMGFKNKLTDLGITASMDLNSVLQRTENQTFGSTDCSLPILYAQMNNIAIDTFVIMTDNETWFGSVHPFIALRDYRQRTGIDAKLVVAGLTTTEFTIADPRDRGMLDVVGADANLPKLVSEFSAGRI